METGKPKFSLIAADAATVVPCPLENDVSARQNGDFEAKMGFGGHFPAEMLGNRSRKSVTRTARTVGSQELALSSLELSSCVLEDFLIT